MAGPNKSKLIPRRTVTAGQGNETEKLDKKEITRLTALTGLMSLFMFGTDATDLFNEETPNTASMAKSMKTKAGKGLFPTLKEIAEAVEPFKKENGEIFKEIKQFGKTFKKYASQFDWMNKVKVGSILKDIRDDVDDLADDRISITPIIDAINNIEIPGPDPMLDVVVDALTAGNRDSIFAKLDDIILRLDQPATKQGQNDVSKLLIEINGSTDLSQLIEQLYILGDKDIVGDTGILSKLDKIISGIKASVEKSLDIDVSKSLANINDVNKLIAAVQNIIMNIQSIKLTNDIDVQLDEQLYKRINDIIEALNQINIDPKINAKIAKNTDTILFLSKNIKTLQFGFLEIIKSLNEFSNINLSNIRKTLNIFSEALNEISTLKLPKTKELEDKVYQFMELKKIFSIISKFEPVNAPALNFGSFIDDIKLIAETYIDPKNIDWIIPIVLKINQISDILKDTNINSLQTFGTAVSNISNGLIELSKLNVKMLKNTFNELSNIEFPEQEIFDNIERMISNINNISLPDFSKIKDLNKFLEDTGKDDTITNLFTNLNNFLSENNAFENDSKASIEQIKSFTKIIEMLISISNVKNPNVKTIDKINKLVADNGQLTQILQNINKNLTQQVSKNAEANLKLVMRLFDTISGVGDIGIIKQIRMKKNIWFIKHFLIKDIISVIEYLHKSAENVQKEQDGKQFKIFASFIDAIIKLGEIDKQSKAKMVKNLWWIKHFIANMTTEIIEQLAESTKDIESKSTKEKLAILANFIGLLPEIANFGIKKFIKYSIKVDILRNFIRTSIQDLITEIGNLKATDEAKTSFDNIGDIIESMNDALDKLASIKKILTYIIKISSINDLIMTQLIKYGNYTIRLQSLIENIDNNELARLSSIITNINDSLEKFKNVDYVTIYDNIVAGIDSLSKLNKFTNALLKVGKNAQEIDPESVKNIKIIVDQISEINFGILSDAISKSSDADKFFKNIQPLIKGANTIAKLGIAESVLEKGANGVNKMIDKLIEGINKFDNVNQQSIDNATKTIDAFMQLVIKSAAIMILGAVAMIVIDVKNLIAFTLSLTGFIIGVGYALKCAASIVTDSSETIDAFGTLIVKSALVLIFGSLVYTFLSTGDVLGFAIILTGFIFGVTYAYKIASKSLTESMESVKDFTYLIVASGFTLILGSIVAHFISFEDIATFTGMLLAFIAGTMFVYIMASKHMGKAVEGLRDFTVMIVASGIVLALGSLITKHVSFEDIGIFTLMLGAFIAGTMFVYIMASKHMGKAVEGLRDFTIMIVASGIVLALGSLITKYVKFADIFTFTLMLGLFIGATMLVYIVASNCMGDAMTGLREFALLIVGSAIVLALGSLITKKIGIVPVLAFTGMLTLFIVSTMLVYVIASYFMDDAMKGATDLGILILISAVSLMVGSLIVSKIGWKPVLAFAGILAVFVGGIMLIYVMASNYMKNAMKGAIELGVLVLLSAISLSLGALVVSKIGWKPVAAFGAMLLLFVGGIMLIYVIASNYMKRAIKGAAEFGVLVLLSAISLSLGALVVSKVGWEPVALFGVILLAFVGGITWIYSKFKKKILASLPAAAAMGTLAILSSAALGIGIIFMDKYPNGADKIIGFVLADLLLVGGFALILKRLGKIKKNVAIQGSILLGIIVGIAALSTVVIGMIASIGEKYDLNKTWVVIGQIAVVIVGLIAIASILGLAAVNGGEVLIAAGVAILTTIVGIAVLAAKAMEAIASAMIAMQSVKKFDPKPIVEGIKSFVEIVKELKPLAADALVIMLASDAIRSLKYVLSDISQAVKEYAELKIPIYEGTKAVGYRQLDKKDFKSAADNVKIIIKTLGKAVIDTYEKNPEIFAFELFGGSPFARVTKSLKTLGPMLAGIAKAVKDYASLRIPIYSGTKLTGYDTLKQQNFKEAGDNVKLIIETLGGAVMASYDAHPDMFETSFFGNSPFSKVTKSLKTLGPMLSRIAKSVKDYASLLIPNYGNGTKIVKYDKLTNQHFKDAANNVKLIIETLGGAIIKVYEEHPDYYETSGGFLGFGESSPFGRTVSANMKLAKLISKISRSVRDFASSRIPIKWDSKGNAIEFESLTQKHFDAANKSIIAVMTTLGGAVIESGKKMEAIGGPDYFKDVVNAQSKLGKLISKITKSVLRFAQGKVPTSFDAKSGEPTGYENLGEKHFRAASNSIIAVITTLGKAVMKSGEEMEKTLSPKDFKKVVEAQSKLGNLISSISESVLNFANGKVPIGYNEDGNAKGYEPLGEKHFIKASNAIQKVITTLGQSIIDAYEQHGEWFDDGEDSKFAMATKAIGSMGSMISSIAGGMQAYADMKIPIYDEKGEITGYKPIDDEILVNASKTIGKIITNLGQTIMNEYDTHSEWFDNGPESSMAMASESIGSMGSMLSSIAEGIQSYANLMIPDQWDEKGNPIHFTKMKEQDFIDAGNNVGKIVSLLGKTIINLYNGKDFEGKQIEGLDATTAKYMFQFDPEKQNDSPFNNVLNSCMMMGEMITSISEGVQSYALLNMPTEFDSTGKPIKFKKMDPGMFGEAAKNIGLVISTIGNAIMTAFGEHKEWFELPTIKTAAIIGFFGAVTESPNPGDPPFMKVMKSLSLMGAVITSVANGVKVFASGRVPKYDESGKIIGYEKMDDNVFTAAANAISSVITIMGNTFDTVYNQHRRLFFGDTSKKITDATLKMGLTINAIATAIQTYANLKYPTAWDDDGKPISFEKMTKNDFIDAANTIKTVITTIAEAIADASGHRVFADPSISILGLIKVSAGNRVVNMLTSLQKTSSVLSSLSSTIQQYANLRYAIAWDLKGKPIAWKHLDKNDFTSAAESIKKIITHIASSIVDAVDGNERIFGQNIFKSPAYTAAIAIGKMGEALNVIAKSISYYAKSEFPVITWNNGKANTTIHKLNPDDFESAKKVIRIVTLCLAETIDAIYKEYPQLFNISAGSAIDSIKNGVSAINTIIQTLSKQIEEISKVNFSEFVKSLSGESDSLKNAIDILANMFNAMQYGSKTTIKNESDRNLLNPLFALQDDTNIRKIFDKIPDALGNMLSVVQSLLDTISAISDQSTLRRDSIESLQIKTVNNAIDKIINIFDEITKLQNELSGDNNEFTGAFSQNNSQLIIDDILSIQDIVLTVIDTLKLWQDNISKLTDVSLENSIIAILKGYQEVAFLVKSINSSLTTTDEGPASSLQDWFSGIMIKNDDATVIENINALNTSITDLITIASMAEEYGANGYDIIGNGIETIQNAVNKIKGIQTFSQHRDVLDKYVNTINTLDLNKMNSMTNFVNAMNSLANKMGNLDKLTLAIAENLTSVLEKLTVRMEDAKATILKSEELQDKRQKRLEQTISNIKEIMSQKLTIEISAVNDTTDPINTTTNGKSESTQRQQQSRGGAQTAASGGQGGSAQGGGGRSASVISTQSSHEQQSSRNTADNTSNSTNTYDTRYDGDNGSSYAINTDNTQDIQLALLREIRTNMLTHGNAQNILDRSFDDYVAKMGQYDRIT